MKKSFYLLIILTILSSNLTARCDFIGANFIFAANTMNEISGEVGLNTSLFYGTFINKNNAWGIQLGGKWSHINDGYSTSEFTSDHYSINIGPFYRYYIDISNRLSFFTHCYIDISAIFYDADLGTAYYTTIYNKNFQIMAGAQPGLSYNLNKSFNIEAGIGNLALSYIISDGDADNLSVFSLDLNTISFSLLYKF